MVRTIHLDFEQLRSKEEGGKFYPNRLIIDYLSGNSELQTFYKCLPQLSNFKNVIEERSKMDVNRALLVKRLKDQYSSLADVPDNIELLSNTNTFTVTTGHQLCLFTGPLYFIYKIITTINLAESLKSEYPEYNFVPIYWMASEDHDFEEVNHISLYGKTIEWDRPQNGAVGEMPTKSIVEIIEQIGETISGEQHSQQIISLLQSAYLDQKTLANATRAFAHALFGKYGLVVIEPNDREFKKVFSPIAVDDILNQTAFGLVNKTNNLLSKLKYKIQLNPREVNCFYIMDSLRERIVAQDNGEFEVVNTEIRFSKEELINEIEAHPERFSPNALMRTLYQEALLPNLAYIGGPAEIAYWLQCKGVFDHYNISYPILKLRSSAMIVNEQMASKIDKLGLQIVDFFNREEDIEKSFVKNNSGNESDLDNERKQLDEVFKRISAKLDILDPSLVASSQALQSKTEAAIAELEKKILKTEKKRNQDSINRIKKIKSSLFPNKSTQERVDNITPYIARYGASLIDVIKEELKYDEGITILAGKEN